MFRSTGFGTILGLILILLLLEFFVQTEAEPVLAFVTYREIREDEVASRIRAVKVNHASDRCTRQYRKTLRVLLHSTLGDVPGLL